MSCTFTKGSLISSPSVSTPPVSILTSTRVDIICLRGLYYKKVYDKPGMHGLLIFSEVERFKSRSMYHRDY